MERLSCVHGRVFNNYLEINNRRFDNECVKSQATSGVAMLPALIRIRSLRRLCVGFWKFQIIVKIFSTFESILSYVSIVTTSHPSSHIAP